MAAGSLFRLQDGWDHPGKRQQEPGGGEGFVYGESLSGSRHQRLLYGRLPGPGKCLAGDGASNEHGAEQCTAAGIRIGTIRGEKRRRGGRVSSAAASCAVWAHVVRGA